MKFWREENLAKLVFFALPTTAKLNSHHILKLSPTAKIFVDRKIKLPPNFFFFREPPNYKTSKFYIYPPNLLQNCLLSLSYVCAQFVSYKYFNYLRNLRSYIAQWSTLDVFSFLINWMT